MNKLNFLTLIGCLLLIINCSEKNEALSDELFSDNKYYLLDNKSSRGIKIEIILNDSIELNSSFKNSIELEANTNEIFLEENKSIIPNEIFEKIEVYDLETLERLNQIHPDEFMASNDTIKYEIHTPNTNSSPLTEYQSDLNVYIDETSLFGIYGDYDYPNLTTYFFNSNNNLVDFDKFNIPVANRITINNILNNTLIASSSNVYTEEMEIVKSINKGVSWESSINFPLDFGEDYLCLDYVSDNSGWFFIYNDWSYTSVYKITNDFYEEISILQNFCVKACKFFDNNNGFIIANTSDNVSPSTSRDLYFMKTTNGGKNWSSPIEISSEFYSNKMFAFNQKEIFLIPNENHQDSNLISISYDGGLNWETKKIFTDDKEIIDIHFVNEKVAYLKTKINTNQGGNLGDVYKTIDGAKTWNLQTKSNKFGDRIYFYNEDIGLMQDKNWDGYILNITENGGVTWKEILYPYNYILDE